MIETFTQIEKEIAKEIEQLKKEQNAIILAHYYVDEKVQQIADYVGDSYYLSKIGKEASNQTILFCGVSFMGESAKILSPQKTVIMADHLADCPMAHMVDLERIDEVRNEYGDVAVVAYINSTAAIKAKADVCVTSSNAVKVVKALPQKNIFFIPDEHLGRYVKAKVPEKNFILNEGFCHVHTSIKKENVLAAKKAKPKAEVLVHPECTEDVVLLADYVGSTLGIIDYATQSEKEEFIICTEMGILYELQVKNPNKKFYSVGHRQFCPNMKRISLEKMRNALKEKKELRLDEELANEAKKALFNMHHYAD
jgi:quinolinate synthase